MAEPAAALSRDATPGVAGSPQPVLVVDDDAVAVEASLGACRMLGVGRAEVVGRPFATLLEPEARERFGHFWRAFRDSGGHGGPFQLDAPAAAVSVEITVEAEVLPSRHLVSLAPAPQGTPALTLVDGPRTPAQRLEPRPARKPTAREREILGLLATGATDAQIATRLDLSPATVQTHVRNAKAKLGARTRAQAVALALRRGLIPAA